MKRFQFEQEQVLKLRRRQRDAAETQLRKLAEAIRQVSAAEQECQNDLTRLAERIALHHDNRVSSLGAISQQMGVHQEIAQELSKLEAKQMEARETLSLANAKVEALELLREAKLVEHRQSNQKKEQEDREYRSLTTWLASQQVCDQTQETPHV